ncbi:Polysaccharide lyase family 8, C-terminal beta-sandwich domain [Alkalispirochaeta americana]|uniref:Polysaccharide lyase family 8, C-terminal beta-sandwich domain n=1 Tax=Alkalispirochaeta americana TaxID=159291 RepID=A0A1N6XLT1_9SPIO|nr:1,3-beta-galactosyl-N-acetylhexosamine phosphorylase N-terminal domain-containing protein [Alkalispirochaeta americana]SIR03336.1 Polysaccharide lyase family 8, C-terminal beta-sandwich domain [Alkalispirochaeta americana]
MSEKKHTQGHVPLPVEAGQEATVKSLHEYWQADALWDSDGTEMPESLVETGCDIYSTICLVRADQDFADSHPEYLHRKYLMSFPVNALDSVVEIVLLSGYSREKYQLDEDSPASIWWEVRDRTTNTIVDMSDWDVDFTSGSVRIRNTQAYHEYTISFLVRQIWDTDDVHGVYDPLESSDALSFFTAGEQLVYNDISVRSDAPVLVLICGTTRQLSVSDPEQNRSVVTLDIAWGQETSRISVPLPSGAERGESIMMQW